MPTTPPRHNFDIDLEFGNFWEDRVCRMLEGEGTVEVKADRMWANTGNLAFEHLRYDLELNEDILTGITQSKARWWCSVLCDPIDLKTSAGIRIWETKRLKSLLADLLKGGEAWVRKGIGEGGRTSVILVPINSLNERGALARRHQSESPVVVRRRELFESGAPSAGWEVEAFNLLTNEQ